MLNRLAYFLPRNSFPWEPTVTDASLYFCIRVNNPSIIPNLLVRRPAAQIWAAVAPGVVDCETEGGRFIAWHQWDATRRAMPHARFALAIEENAHVPGLLFRRQNSVGEWIWPEVWKNAIGCDLTSGARFETGEFAGLTAIEANVRLCRELLAMEGIRGLVFDASPRTMGYPSDARVLAPLRGLAPDAGRIVVNGIFQGEMPAWPGAFDPITPWATDLKYERSVMNPRGYLPRDFFDRVYCMFDGAEFGFSKLGLAYAGHNAVWHIAPTYPWEETKESFLRLQVGMFCLVMQNDVKLPPKISGGAPRYEQMGPWISAHETYAGEPWGGLLANAELLRWTQMRAVAPMHRLSGTRIYQRYLEDDGGQRYVVSVNFENRQIAGHKPFDASLIMRP
ncbi:MAG: hypothetical protein KC729_19950 [Candidatus Eisenbacteria bacterium]|uniref:Uncharacterized protein n=1 Tax=Eiseniibacteriota bacterium TaxID=2212470 RepID=A0A956M2X8_UNCEI|nr:hypothetical protein [Candidatus Eisenbacteria bacterium]